jgi:hypothetical protein
LKREEQTADVASSSIGERGEGTSARASALWQSADALLERATLPGIITHKLGPLAAHRLRRLGDPLPERLVIEERATALSMLTAVPIIERARANSDGPLLLLKGPELARLYPGRARRFHDIDLLSTDASAVQQALIESGFIKVHDPEYDRFGSEHSLNALRWPTLELMLEVHSGPHWPRFLPQPPLQEVFDASVPSALGIAGVSTPAPVHHALMLAAHAWAHGAYEPLWRLRDLIDIAAVTADAREAELERTAKAWGLERLWDTTWRAIDALFYDGGSTPALRLWGRHLTEIRAQRAYERYLERLLSTYWVMPPGTATRETLRLVRAFFGREPTGT